jgi:2-polyprenyl-6-methoxyphenol hydroxylase-like FAD-dependent oxidoreductase
MWLRRLGMRVVVAEARETAALGEGAFLGVAPNGMNVLADLGLADAVAARGHACDAFRFTNRHDRQIGFIDRSHDRGQFRWPLTMIRRGDLHALLAAEAERRGVEIRFGKRLAAIERTGSTAIAARFRDGSSVTADILVGADGLRSKVRDLVLPDAQPPAFTGLIDTGGFAPISKLPFPRSVNQMVFGRRAFFGAFTTPAGETWWFHNGPAPDPAQPQQPITASALRARMLELHAEDPPWIRDVIAATPDILGPWPIYELGAMPRWSEGRICLVGDAAHAMSPSAGQGASLAMEDAVVLAQCLRDIPDPTRAFAELERRRRPRVDRIFKQAQRNGSGKAMDSRLSEWFRDRLLPMFLRFGASSQTRSYAYRIPWTEPA